MGMSGLSPCARLVRANDPDRYFCVLFAGPARRDHLFALYAFNHELARVAETVSEPMLGHVRLRWWRDSLDGVMAGKPGRHEALEAP